MNMCDLLHMFTESRPKAVVFIDMVQYCSYNAYIVEGSAAKHEGTSEEAQDGREIREAEI